MRQVALPRIGEVAIDEVPSPEPAPGEVSLRVAAVGICGSDLHVFHGQHPIVAPPLVQGHEFSAWIAPTRADGSTEPPTLVAVNPAIGCGVCRPCRQGLTGLCPDLTFIGSAAVPGALSDYLVAPAEYVVAMRPGTDPMDAAMVEPLACAVRAVGRAGGVARSSVLVVGGGTIGNLVAQVSAHAGARVALVERVEARREIARACGLVAFEEASAAVEYLRGDVDVAFECVGSEGALTDCVEVVSPAGTVVVVGVHSRRPAVDISAVQDRELRIVGSLMYSREEFVEAAAAVDRGRFHLDPLRTHRFDLAEVDLAYRTLDDPAHGALKVMIEVHAQ